MIDYREWPVPSGLEHLARAAWTLDVAGEAPDWVDHRAVPDGSVELILRRSGRSRWHGEQPRLFVAGLLTGPATLRLGRGSSFIGLRLRPWAWNALGEPRAADFLDSWRPAESSALQSAMEAGVDEAVALLRPDLLGPEETDLARAIVAGGTMAEIGSRSGWPARRIQRWFEKQVGMAPRTYLGHLRFEQAFAALGDAPDRLADHAADHGYADQAHMARAFRRLSGTAASRARGRSSGPFLAETPDPAN